MNTGARQRQGFALGVLAYLIWGAFPLYWPLLRPAGAVEILAHRVVWSLLTMALVVSLTGRLSHLKALIADRRSRVLLAVAAVTIAINWGTHIYGVNSHRVVETSLGYFINPLVTVLMGVILLGERLRSLQWFALGVGAIAVLGIAIEYGRPPWIALILAFSFGSYGLLKKQADVDAVESLTYETIVLAPIAVGYLTWLGIAGEGHFSNEGLGHAALMMTAGAVTAVPLLCFGAAAIRVPMTTIGLLQYLTPILQFLLGVFALHEHMTTMRWLGFGLVWVALAIFTVDAWRSRTRVAEPSFDAEPSRL
ncbi:MAG TPA: EamA family transporter RarD [Marmoricola sp.]|nr:EamA family transporter RarD [Marmoricola sp.]